MDQFDFLALLNWGWKGFSLLLSLGIILFFFMVADKKGTWKAWFFKWFVAGAVAAALTMGVVALFPPNSAPEQAWAQISFADTISIWDAGNKEVGQVTIAAGESFLQSAVNGKLPESTYTPTSLPKNELFYNLKLTQKGRTLKTYQLYFYTDKEPVVYGRVMLRKGYVQTVEPVVIEKIADCITANGAIQYN